MFSSNLKLALLAAAAFLLGGGSAVLVEKKTIFIERKVAVSVLTIDLSREPRPSMEGRGKKDGAEKRNTLSGRECENYTRRPFAVMIAEDEEARPLLGIGSADLVIEMPVVSGSITRMMALFACEDPKEIGSVRSARHNFIPLAQGFDAILVHWGGSHFALDELKKGLIDNLDALPNHFDAFYRKNWIPAPHNGFTSMRRMMYAAQSLGYRLTSQFSGYKFIQTQNPKFLPTGQEGKTQNYSPKSQKLILGYVYPYNVTYEYNATTNTYYRWRGGREEIDRLTQTQVGARNVVIMRAYSRQIEGDYNDIDILGSGDSVVHTSGKELKGTWVKKKAEDVLRFYDEENEEISFAPGPIWIEVVEPDTIVRYE